MNMAVRIILAVLGIILLLPGLCSAGFVVLSGTDQNRYDPLLILLWLVTFLIAWGGFVLIRKAWRGQ